MIKAIVFDIGGVLYDEGEANSANIKICKKFNLNLDKLLKARDRFLGPASIGRLSAFEYLASIGRKLKIKKLKKFVEFSYKTRKDEIILRKDADNLIKRLKKKYIIGGLTNITKTNDKIRIEKKFYKHFDFVLKSCEEGMKKPDVKFYKLLLKKVRAMPEEIVFVDDNKKYLIPARKIGMKTILFKNNKQLIKELRKLKV